MSEQERQKRLVKLKLEERRLRKEGQLDELHRLLGEGFEMDANLRKLMGENKARYASSWFRLGINHGENHVALKTIINGTTWTLCVVYQVTAVVFYRYEEKLKERLAKRRERLAQGLPVDDEDEEDLEDGLAEGEEVTDVKAILEDLDKRYIQD